MSKSRFRILSFCDKPSRPSVSKISVRWFSSSADHTPIVHELVVGDVLNFSWPLKKILFNVYDFPSPVLPMMETHLTLGSFEEDFSWRMKSASLLT